MPTITEVQKILAFLTGHDGFDLWSPPDMVTENTRDASKAHDLARTLKRLG